jgi:hypothetical protein
MPTHSKLVASEGSNRKTLLLSLATRANVTAGCEEAQRERRCVVPTVIRMCA